MSKSKQKAAPEPVARRVEYTDGGFSIWTWCPGCEGLHPFVIEDPARRINRGVTWEWDGNLESPTFSPSLLVHSSVHLCEDEHPPAPCELGDDCEALGHLLIDGSIKAHPTPHTRDPAYGPCHSFLKHGVWEFLPDSAHHLTGSRHPMVPLPKAWAED